ncbi:alpha-hydroxy-acid oxidizing protein [Rhizobiaceae bacterium BDR2-2]|uniref:Alpha-hydroxy-acid oxidizing protein n=2 Tax=Ectorhizobium quercum TaxID=2965071 RepID=A0AAE3N6Z1_9HYPH|nr:alpha-hydroxy-acid oxidizing protein [Ectorhizobium quercum]
MLPYQAEAEAAIGKDLYRYLVGRAVDGGAEDANEAAFRRFCLVPRVLSDIRGVDLATTLFGVEIAAPVVVGAFAGDRLFHAEGLAPVARVCKRLRLPLVVSEETVTPLARITALHDRVLLQLRAAGPVERARSLVEHAADAGAVGIVLTVLAPAHPIEGLRPGGFDVGQALRDRGWTTIGSDRPGPMPLPAFPNWTARDISEVADSAKARGLHLVVKGVLHPGDVAACEQAGAGTLMVSNIGLRQSSRWLPAPLALPGMRAAASKGTAVLADGGIRHGSDVLIARLLGADAAVVSRPVLTALAGAGEKGVESYLSGLIDSLTAMTLWMGAGRIEDLRPDQLARADGTPLPYGKSDV